MNFLLVLAAFVVFLIAFIFFQTIRFKRIPTKVEAVEIARVKKDEALQHLSQLIQIRSISREGEVDQQPFLDIHVWIEKTYPLISNKLQKKIINDCSLLYTWQGSDPKLAPVLLNAHLDVVPVEESTLADWVVDPFSGEKKDGFVWGRGAIDMKAQATGIMEAVESLLAEGFSPKRTIYLAFGHDEEVMGKNGSQKISEHLRMQGVHLAALLDEGGFITSGAFPGVQDPFALIGISEKGYLTLQMSAAGKPGHSSTPPRQTAIGIIARALALLDDQPFPARSDFVLPTLHKLSYLLPFDMQLVAANSWLFKKILVNQLGKSAQLNAMIRTTHAATIIQGGIKDNVLPAAASAKVNFRLLPGDSIESVIQHVKRVVADPRVEIKIDELNGGWEASQVSPVDTPAYYSLELITRQVFNNVLVAPFVFLAATDSRHYQAICKNIYKFSPLILSIQEQQGMHGINERISIDGFKQMITFYMRILRVWGEAEF